MDASIQVRSPNSVLQETVDVVKQQLKRERCRQDWGRRMNVTVGKSSFQNCSKYWVIRPLRNPSPRKLGVGDLIT